MDTSMGRGGDINKYLSSTKKIRFIFGLDISPDIQEACWRYYKVKKDKPRALLMQYDTSKNIIDGSGLEGSDAKQEQNKILLDIIYNKKRKIPPKYKEIRDRLAGIANERFDIISCQFSLHYYFKDESTLRGYLQNISENCHKGGYFIGTCYDGMNVFQTLQETPMIDYKDDFENIIYKIEKKYEIDDFKFNVDNIDNMYGNEINVYINSIGQEITEYLVNFEFFIHIMGTYGFKPVKPYLHGKNSGIFDSNKYSMMDGFGSFKPILDNLDDMSKRDPRIKKFYSESLSITSQENKKLYELSCLHNWFIFQRV